jgi:hypothetical protein
MFQANAVEKTKTRVLRSVKVSENSVVYEITWKNIAEPDRPLMSYGA